MTIDPGMVVYGSALALIWGAYTAASRRHEARSSAIKKMAEEGGLTEPVTMHPAIDPALCVGCGTCVKACPEGDVLGVIAGRAELVAPTHCIGHGECAKSCPVGAISLVFGTAKRGVELPQIGTDFQTNVPGLYIAGELGGMGLIRNAVEQGRQAVEAIHRRGNIATNDLDLLIAGAGPAGIAAALTAKSLGLRYQVVEQDDLGGAVFKYPRGKVVMTAPALLPIIGLVKFRETSKEELLAFWRGVESSQKLAMSYRERVESIERRGSGFEVRTTRRSLSAGAVLLAVGRRGTPRTLGVPGEDLPKTVYQLTDPEQYRNNRVLVVGGGDSALEAAISLARQPGVVVTLSYRNSHFARARLPNRRKIETLAAEGRIRVVMSSEIARISKDAVDLDWNGAAISVPNDAVIVCAGGVMPGELLKQCGISMVTKYGTA